MRTHDGSPTGNALPMLLGLALVGWAGSVPAFAQDTANQTTPNPSMTNQTPATPTMTPPRGEAAEDVLNDETARAILGLEPGQDPDSIPDPAPLNYPYAGPGGLQLFHWADYTKFKKLPGSVNDVYFYQDKMRRIDLDQNGHVRWRHRPLYYRRYEDQPQSAAYHDMDQTARFSDSDMFSRLSGMGSGGDFIYIVRGNTLYQIRIADMSIAAQKDLPAMNMTGTGTSVAGTSSDQSSQPFTSETQFNRRMWNSMRPVNVVVNGDNLFILRGSTLYQFHVADLSLAGQKDLPAMGIGGTNLGTGTTSPSSTETTPPSDNTNNNGNDTSY
jgi:hypothetical protein